MTVRAYRTQPFQTTHENRVFDALRNELERVWGHSEEILILLGNFYCHGSEIDAAILKRDSISVIDFKDYEGPVRFSENGRWFAGDVEIKGGNKRNPYLQIRDSKFRLLDFLKGIGGLSSGRQPNFGHISGIVLFHRPITFDDTQLPPRIAPWFYVVDLDHAAERLSQITSREIDLSPADLEAIATAFSIPEHLPVGAQVKAPSQVGECAEGAESDLPVPLQSAMSQIAEFIDSSDERILVVAGMVGTGTQYLYKAIIEWVCL